MPTTQSRRRTRDGEDSEEDSRPRQRRNRQDSDDEVEDDSGEDMDVDAGATQTADDQLAKKLVRYAISCEYSRTPIRRDGIKERVLGDRGRSFRRIFALAQKQLRFVWGMELRELPVREKMTLQEKRKAMSSNTQPKTGSGSYILASNLPAAYRDAAIIPPSKTPSIDEEATYVAFCTLVVSCIWLNGGELTEQKLKRYLVRLNADRNVSTEKTDVTLKKMERQGYVIKRVDRPPIGQDGEQTINWHIGTRAREEIGLDGVMGMVREVFGDSTPDLEKKLRASLGIKERVNANEEAAEEETTAPAAGGNDRDDSE